MCLLKCSIKGTDSQSRRCLPTFFPAYIFLTIIIHQALFYQQPDQCNEIKHLIWLTYYPLSFLGSRLTEDPPLEFYSLTGIYTKSIVRTESQREGTL